MEREPTTEELINKITLLEKILDFYANEKNYPDMVNTDKGSQAKFGLESIKKINDFESDMILKLKSAIENEEELIKGEDVIKELNKIKGIINNIK